MWFTMVCSVFSTRLLLKVNTTMLIPVDAKIRQIGHFRVPPSLCFQTRVGAQPLTWKSFFVLM